MYILKMILILTLPITNLNPTIESPRYETV
jgi:hypothetical protein